MAQRLPLYDPVSGSVVMAPAPVAAIVEVKRLNEEINQLMREVARLNEQRSESCSCPVKAMCPVCACSLCLMTHATKALMLDHYWWTRSVVKAALGGTPDVAAALDRLKQNQSDIAFALSNRFDTMESKGLINRHLRSDIKWQGREPLLVKLAQTPPDARLSNTVLVRQKLLWDEHIDGAVAVVTAVAEEAKLHPDWSVDKIVQTERFSKVNKEWYRNATDIAKALYRLNTKAWVEATLVEHMKKHLDTLTAQVVTVLLKQYDKEIKAGEVVKQHLLMLAESLAVGMI